MYPPKAPSPKKGKKQLKERKKRPRLLQKGVRERDKNLFIRLQESDEGKALWALWMAKRFNDRIGRTAGHLDGYTLKTFRRLQARARHEAKIIVEYMMEKELIPKDGYAKEAIETAVEMMRLDAIHPRDKLAAAKVVLEYTMQKPATTSNVNVKSAEDFLDEVAKDAGIG